MPAGRELVATAELRKVSLDACSRQVLHVTYGRLCSP